MKLMTHDILRCLFDYDPEGYLTVRVRYNVGLRVGKRVGCKKANTSIGYRTVTVLGQTYLNHRLIFLWHHGYLPEMDIDHINRVRTDDRIENLREVSRQCNSRNSCIKRNSTSSVNGICWDKNRNKWFAHIKLDYKQRQLGRYEDFYDAVAARLAAEQCLGWGDCIEDTSAAQVMRRYLCK